MVIASAQAIVAFAGVGSDVAARDVLAEAGAVSVLLAHLPPTEMDMPQTVSDSAALETVDPQTPAKVAVASEAVDVPATDEADVGNQTLGAVLRALAELALPAVACAPGADKVLRHLREPPALNLLRALLATQGSAEHCDVHTDSLILCLSLFGCTLFRMMSQYPDSLYCHVACRGSVFFSNLSAAHFQTMSRCGIVVGLSPAELNKRTQEM